MIKEQDRSDYPKVAEWFSKTEIWLVENIECPYTKKAQGEMKNLKQVINWHIKPEHIDASRGLSNDYLIEKAKERKNSFLAIGDISIKFCMEQISEEHKERQAQCLKRLEKWTPTMHQKCSIIQAYIEKIHTWSIQTKDVTEQQSAKKVSPNFNTKGNSGRPSEPKYIQGHIKLGTKSINIRHNPRMASLCRIMFVSESRKGYERYWEEVYKEIYGVEVDDLDKWRKIDGIIRRVNNNLGTEVLKMEGGKNGYVKRVR